MLCRGQFRAEGQCLFLKKLKNQERKTGIHDGVHGEVKERGRLVGRHLDLTCLELIGANLRISNCPVLLLPALSTHKSASSRERKSWGQDVTASGEPWRRDEYSAEAEAGT
jgi:hypothetical protein